MQQVIKKVRETCNQKENATNIKVKGFWVITIERRISTKSIKETIRNVNAKTLKEHVKEKHKHNADFIYIKARRVFNNKHIDASIIKCLHRLNHHTVRDAMTNNKMVEDKCPRYNNPKT